MKNNQLQRVTRAQAAGLLAVGFDWCTILLDNEYSFPTVALALKWMRDVKGIMLGIHPVWGRLAGRPYFMFHEISYLYGQLCDIKGVRDAHEAAVNGIHDAHEAAESILLDELLKLFENGNKNL